MPLDKSGRFHLNTQRAMAADKFAANRHEQSKPAPGEPATKGPNEDEGDVKSHLAKLHEKLGGKHMHIHDDGMGGLTTHHVDEDGEVQGPHNHENLEALKEHMDRFLDEEGHEGEQGDEDEEPDYHGLSGL